MRVKTVTYAMLRVQKQFENDRVEITIELDPGELVDVGITEAKRLCEAALKAPATAAPNGRIRSTVDQPATEPPARDLDLYPTPRKVGN